MLLLLLLLLLLAYYVLQTGKGSREAISFYQTLITDAHSHAPHCSPAQLYSMVSSMMDVSEYNAGFALLVEKHLTDTYAFWSTQSFIKLMTVCQLLTFIFICLCIPMNFTGVGGGRGEVTHAVF